MAEEEKVVANSLRMFAEMNEYTTLESETEDPLRKVMEALKELKADIKEIKEGVKATRSSARALLFRDTLE